MPKLTVAERIERMKEDRTVPRAPRLNGIDDERAMRITRAMADPNHQGRHQVITLTRKVLHFSGLSQFLREGKLADVEHVERLLGIN